MRNDERTVLLALAARCEAASGPDREIEIGTLREIDPERVAYMNEQFAEGAAKLMALGGEAWAKRKESLYSQCYTPPRYTRSIDAAMTLKLEGHTWAAGDCNEDDRPWACVTSVLDTDEDGGCKDFTSTAATVELALTAAWIRARAAASSDRTEGAQQP